MYNTRWWDIAVAAGLAAIAALSLAGLGAAGPSGWWLTAVSLFVFVAGYAFLRPGIVSGAAPTWRLAVGIPLVVLAIVIGIAAAPFLAMLQTLAYPLVWVTTPARREAIVGSAGVALGALRSVERAIGRCVQAGLGCHGLVVPRSGESIGRRALCISAKTFGIGQNVQCGTAP